MAWQGGGITPTLSGNHLTRTFQVDPSANVTLNALNIMDGYCSLCDGGGIYNRGTLSITNSSVRGNATSNGDDVIASSGRAGGGIFNVGTLFLANSVISNNRTGQGGNGNSFNGLFLAVPAGRAGEFILLAHSLS
jgi:hypothetical protein